MQISKGNNKKKFVLKKEILLERRILEAQVTGKIYVIL